MAGSSAGDFEVVEVARPGPRPRAGARAQHVDLGRPRAPAASPDRCPGRLLRRLPPRSADGRDHGGRRGGRVARRRLRPRRHGLARAGLAGLRGRRPRRDAARRHRDADQAGARRHRAAVAPRPTRRDGTDGVRRAARRRCVEGRGDGLGLRRGRCGRKPGRRRSRSSAATAWSPVPAAPSKVGWLHDVLGVHAFDYHDGELVAQLRDLAPEGLDVYFDSVGGAISRRPSTISTVVVARLSAGRSPTTSRRREVRATCSWRSRRT